MVRRPFCLLLAQEACYRVGEVECMGEGWSMVWVVGGGAGVHVGVSRFLSIESWRYVKMLPALGLTAQATASPLGHF